jgi:hypothetical protein
MQETGRFSRVKVLLGLLLLQGFAAAQGVAWDELKKGIVRIETNNKRGVGVVIVAAPAVIRIVTFRHLVSDSTRVTATFYSDRATPFEAQVLPDVSDSLDLAVLEVQLNRGKLPPKGIPSYGVRHNNSLRETEKIWIIDFYWNLVPSSIAALSSEGNVDKLMYPRSVTARGFSGAPVFDDEGQLIGLHGSGESSARYGVAVKVESAIAALNAIGYSTPNLDGASTLDGEWVILFYGPNGTPTGGMEVVISGGSAEMILPNDSGANAPGNRFRGQTRFDGRNLQIKITSFINPLTGQPYDVGNDPAGAAAAMEMMSSYMHLSFVRQEDGSFTGSVATGERMRMVRQGRR